MIPLLKPPGYSYRSIPPYTVTHERSDDDWETWQFNDLAHAVTVFYGTHLNVVERRVLFDARGTTILGLLMVEPPVTPMVATKEAADTVLRVMGKADPDRQAEILGVFENIKDGNGLLT